MAEEDNPKEVTVAAVAAETSDEFVQDAVPEKIDANDAEQTESNGQLEVASGDVDNGKTAAELLEEDIPWIERFKQVFWTYLPLGFVAFGGPQAHVAILRDHLVVQRNWLDEDQFTELFAIGQGLPGPTSTQLVVSTALARAGPIGGLTAFFLWNLPGLIVLTVCGVLIATFVDENNPPWYLIGLPPAAISLVFKAFYGFGKKLDKLGIILCLISSLVAIMINGSRPKIDPLWSQYIYPSMLACGGIVSYLDSIRGTDVKIFGKIRRVPGKPYGTYKSASKGWDAESDLTMRRIGIPIWVGALIWIAWAVILAVTVSVVGRMRRNGETPNQYLEIFEVMYRIGSLIFGGGQVVLPMLQTEVVPMWMKKDAFLQGLGLAQSMPGPLFNFSSYLGAVYKGVPGALVAYLGLFGPGVMLIFGMVPFWARLRHVKWFKSTLNGVNATAIGLVGAACVILWEGAVTTFADAMVFTLALCLAVVYGIGAPWVVLTGGVFGAILHKDALGLGQNEWCSLGQDL
ncbi:chromate transporter [Skeletonema marinoi]|uniref:Chromate transporter n=2 Tax=Skeletonema marinoi TaxID=267567 RepID=A0AAD8YCU0_9STRA|nr:chromate transporter [Skeletonema marinoi]